MKKHSAGPWKARRTRVVENTPDGEEFRDLWTIEGPEMYGFNVAFPNRLDASRIAAAPDMEKALVDARETIKALTIAHHTARGMNPEYVDEQVERNTRGIDSALAKARGET